MKKAKPEHRIVYWKYHVAAYSFAQAQDVATQLKDMTDTHELFQPLMLSLHVFYARPFIHDKESRRINAELVPKELMSVHDTLLSMRDRMFAHHDKDSRMTDADTGVDLFQLIVIIKDGQIRPGLQLVFPTPIQIEKVLTLCEYLYNECMKRAGKALEKCVGVMPDDGVYRVATDFKGRLPLLIKSELSRVQSQAHLKETKR